MYDVTTARVEIEISRGWAKNNPDLFTASVLSFADEYPSAEWTHSIDLARSGFITLTAYNREDQEGKYTIEWG